VRDHAPGEDRDGADRRADRGRRAESEQHPAHLIRPVERSAPADQPAKQESTDDDLGHVSRLLADQASDGQPVVRGKQLTVDDQLAEEDSRPKADSGEVEGSDPQSRGRPDRRDGGRVVQCLGSFGNRDIGKRQSKDPGEVASSLRPARGAHRVREGLAA
jgi:hypothetical protein